MAEPYTIRVFIPDGDPEGVKIVELLNWTGVGIALPRASWPKVRDRAEFKRSGIYILTGSAEGADDELPTIYVGQGEEIGARLEAHYTNKDFWDWAYAFVSNANALNRAHITWLEHALIQRAHKAERSHLDNATQPREPGLSESERADTMGFLRKMLKILPLLGVRVFEKPSPVATPGAVSPAMSGNTGQPDERDTVVVPAQVDGFKKVFLGENCWYSIRIGGGMLPKIKYIAAYQTAPVSAITHHARVERIEPYGDGGKYRLVFAEPTKPLPEPIPFADAPQGSMQGPRYTSLARLQSAKRVADLFPRSREQEEQ
ncbi:MAG: GIY-YIG nuclease family protein [Gemmatimonadales bacterium]|nr:GIY-YIG nuclease family protein [Gemmatimonadales bacterium]MDZ4389291.1 GIY-YIG nuclease family protein [Gemmatimonadales bacterium]